MIVATTLTIMIVALNNPRQCLSQHAALVALGNRGTTFCIGTSSSLARRGAPYDASDDANVPHRSTVVDMCSGEAFVPEKASTK